MNNLLIGIGNPLRADDGVGIFLVEKIIEKMTNIETVVTSTANIEILDHIKGKDKVVIIDAIITGAKPGTVHVIEDFESDYSNFASTHTLNILDVISIGRQIYKEEMPINILVFAIEAEDIYSYSNEISYKLKQAIPEITQKIIKEFN